jgi:protoporphyrinogen oxidase
MVCEKGGIVSTGSRVKHVNIKDGRVVSVEYAAADGTVNVVECDWFLSSMPLKELLPSLQGIDIPADIMNVVFRLPYRDFITVGILLDCMKSMKGGVSALRDTWIYLQERNIIAGRMQIFNNWSPYMVADYKNRMFIGLEYFCSEGDSLWQMESADFVAMAIDELVSMGLIERGAVLDATMVKMPKAYPAYYGTYGNLHKVRGFLDGIENLYCIGRNGQHR